jgi:D-alanine--poly(phosphoribitol) ligase subunit 2
MDELIRIMSEVKPDVDFETATTLIDDDLIDSLDIIAIVSEVNDTFDVEINVDDLLPENFNSASALWDLICSLQAE